MKRHHIWLFGAIAVKAAIVSFALTQRAVAQGPLEQVTQTNVMRDQLRAQLAIAEELRTLNKTMRRLECIERYRFSQRLHCVEGVETQNEGTIK